MSGCEYHIGQFDRTCCNGKGIKSEDLKGWIKMEGGTLDWGDDSSCLHTDDPCTKCGKELLPRFKEHFTMTNYFIQAEIAVEMMNQWVTDHPEFEGEWEAWDWL